MRNGVSESAIDVALLYRACSLTLERQLQIVHLKGCKTTVQSCRDMSFPIFVLGYWKTIHEAVKRGLNILRCYKRRAKSGGRWVGQRVRAVYQECGKDFAEESSTLHFACTKDILLAISKADEMSGYRLHTDYFKTIRRKIRKNLISSIMPNIFWCEGRLSGRNACVV